MHIINLSVVVFAVLFLVFNLNVVNSTRIPIIGRRQQTLANFLIDIETKDLHNAQVLLNKLDENNPILLDLDLQTQTIAYVESLSKSTHDQIHLMHMNRLENSQLGQSVIRRQENPDDLITSLSVDWITHNVYLSIDNSDGRQSGRIEACRIDWWLRGERPSTDQCLVIMHRGLDSLYALIVDPLDGYMYWLNRVHKRVERAWMNGQHLDKNPFNEQIPEQQIATIGALTLEPTQRLLFYTRKLVEAEDSEIVSCVLHNRHSCKTLIQRIQAAHLAVFKQFLFWTSIEVLSGLHYCSHEDCTTSTSEIVGSNDLEAFRIADSSVQPNRTNPNPCSDRNGNCSHFCLLTPGVPWRSCACANGVRLLADQLTCDPHGVQKLLLVGSTNGLYYISLDTSDYIPQRIKYNENLSDSRLQKIVDADYDPVDRLIYWIDREASKIRRCKLDGSEFMDLPIGEHEAAQLVIDPLGRNLIWLDSTNGRIELVSLRSPVWSRKTLLSSRLQHSKTLAVDVKSSHIYFSSIHEGSTQIERVHLDGLNRERIVQLNGPNWISSMLIDSNQLFWTDREMSTLMSLNLNNGEGRARVVAEHLDSPNAIAKLDQTIYYNSLGGRSLNAIQLTSPGFHLSSNDQKHEIADSLIYGQMSLKTVNLRQSHLPSTACSHSNGHCDHICVPLPVGYKCLCSMGYELHANNRSCLKPSSFLVYSSKDSLNDLLRLSIYGQRISSQNNREMHIPSVLSTPTVIALNPLTEELIFCTDSSSSPTSTARLIKTNFNGTQSQILLESRSLKSLRGLAVDWLTGNVYWSNGQLKRVQLLRSDGQGQKTIAWMGVDPRQIVVDSISSFFYFVDCFAENSNGKCSIRKCPLSGCSNGGTVFIPDIDPVQSMILDSNLLYWSNGRQIWSIDLNSQNRRDHLDKLISNEVVSSITVHSGQLFYANVTDGTIRRIVQNSQHEILHSNVSNVVSMLIAHSTHNQLPSTLANSLNECKIKANQNGCICVSNNNQQYKCECSDQEDVDLKTGKCKAPTKFVLMSSRDRFVRFKINQRLTSFENVYTKDPFQVLSINNVGHPIAVAFDVLSKRRFVYWIDAFDRDGADVKRAAESQSTTEYLNLAQTTRCSQFHDIVCDTIGHQLFISCSRSQHEPNAFVHVWRIGTNDQLQHLGYVVDGDQKSIASQTYPSPRRLAVFNQLKALFYVDENPSLDSPLIIRCTLEGRYCYSLVSHGLHFHQVRLSSDLATHRLVYTTEDGIWSRDIFVETDVRHPLLIEPYTSTFHQQNNTSLESQIAYIQIGNLAPVDDKTILFSATNQSRYDDLLFQVANNSTVTRIQQLQPLQWAADELLRRRSELLVVGTLSSLGQVDLNDPNFGCLNASCSHLCVASHSRLTNKQFECLCPVGFSRSTNNEHHCQRNIQCESWQFACQNGLECIHSALKCDKIVDCADESDESPLRCNLLEIKNDHIIQTESNDWICDDRRMSISRHLLCNGQIDCADESDEAHCRCTNPSTYFDCNAWDHIRRPDNSTVQCILRSLLCDSRPQCVNVADEMPQVCKHHTLLRNGKWTDNQWLTLLAMIGALFLVFLISICCCACFAYRRSRKKGRYRRCRHESAHSAELSLHFRRFRPSTAQTIVVSSANNPRQYFGNPESVVEVALQTFPNSTFHESEEFPIYESATLPHKQAIPNTYNSLPWTSNRIQHPGSHHSNPMQWPTTYWPATTFRRQPHCVQQDNNALYGAGEALASSSNEATSSFVLPAPTQMRRFHAPPPSAASISTYGIAKPIGLRQPPISRPNNTSTTSSSSSVSPTQRTARRPKRRRKRQRQSDDQASKHLRSDRQSTSESLPPPPYTRE